MKLILDEWIVREVIDTLYMARTTFLGITGLDSPQEVEKKSANETAITRRISKAIDMIQQSEQSPIPNDLEEADELKNLIMRVCGYEKDHDQSLEEAAKEQPKADLEKEVKRYLQEEHDRDTTVGDVARHFTEWQKEQDDRLADIIYQQGIEKGKDDMKEQMLKDAVEGKVFMSFAPGHNQMVMADVDLPTNAKVRVIVLPKED